MSLGMENRELEEDLRKAAADGNEEAVTSMISNGINVNSQNSINGWTALHWACKRGHKNVVDILVKAGANPALCSGKGETCVHVTSDPLIKQLLGVDSNDEGTPGVGNDLPIVPNYIRNPVFPYVSSSGNPVFPYVSSSSQALPPHPTSTISQSRDEVASQTSGELVLKVRIANSAEKDFIEVDLPKESLTYDALLSLMCSELDASKVLVQKVRKLPDTIVRRDKDVQRLRNYQELELVLASQYPVAVNNFQNYKASVAPKHFDVFY